MSYVKKVSVHLLINSVVVSAYEAEMDVDKNNNLTEIPDYLSEEQVFDSARLLKECFDKDRAGIKFDKKIIYDESTKIGADLLAKLNLNCLSPRKSCCFYVQDENNAELFKLRVTICDPRIL